MTVGISTSKLDKEESNSKIQHGLQMLMNYEVFFSTGWGKIMFSQTPLGLRANKSHVMYKASNKNNNNNNFYS